MSNLIRKSLNEVIKEPISGTRPKGGVNLEGDVPSFGGENITMSGEVEFYPVKKITNEFFDGMRRGHLRDLDILINKDGANTGKSAIYRKSPYMKASINEHLFILRRLDDHIDQIYLHYLLQSPNVRKTLETKITGSAQPGLNSSFCRNFPIEVVPLAEQKEIASILISVDEVLKNTRHKIDKLQDLKKAAMNELLTKDIDHKVTISLHQVIHQPISGSRPKGGVTLEGDIPSFGGENITMSGEINFYPVKKITNEFFDGMRRGHLRDLDVLINKDGANTGKSAIYRKSPYIKASINEHLFILRGLDGHIDQIYLHYLLQSPSVRKTLETKITGSAQPGLNSSFCCSFPIEIVPLPEQKKIASILTSVDEMIENTHHQIDKLQGLKKSLMQDLLPGKVRVKVN